MVFIYIYISSDICKRPGSYKRVKGRSHTAEKRPGTRLQHRFLPQSPHVLFVSSARVQVPGEGWRAQVDNKGPHPDSRSTTSAIAPLDSLTPARTSAVASTARMASDATPCALALRQAVAPTARQATILRTQIMLGSKWTCAPKVHGLVGICTQVTSLFKRNQQRE